MPKFSLLICSLLFIVLSSCKKDEIVDTTPQIAAKIAGTYKLSKLLRSPSLVDVTSTATGSATITAKDATTASINYKLTIGTTTQEITSDFKVAQNGTDYTITDNSNNTGAVQNGVLKMTIPFTTLSSTTNYIIEFTK
jgi:hypothetical protein